jgi:diaminopimelate epimerase
LRFSKYHALGNDYLVLNPADSGASLEPTQVRLLCDRHYGVGADGALLGPLPSQSSDFRLRLFNPDGGEFEKSGNGLRIFARYLWDVGLVGVEPFTIETPGGQVTARVHAGGKRVTVEMGRVSFDSRHVPVSGPPREVLDEVLVVDGEELRYSAATVGNPHCVVQRDRISAKEARRLGPSIEREPRFPNRTNVQFMRVLDRARIQIEIWERGVGYTLASGTSACAAAAVARRLGFCGEQIAVRMPGGVLDIAIGQDWSATMTGPVTRVCFVEIADEAFGAGGGEW